MQLQKPVVIIFINVLYSLTTIGTGNLNCNKWDTKLDQSDVSIEKNCIFDFVQIQLLCGQSSDICVKVRNVGSIKMC